MAEDVYSDVLELQGKRLENGSMISYHYLGNEKSEWITIHYKDARYIRKYPTRAKLLTWLACRQFVAR